MSETALVLTQEEWDDLESICRSFRLSTEDLRRHGHPPATVAASLKRRRDLCQRIIEANG